MGKALGRTVVLLAILAITYSTGMLSTAATWVTTEWGNVVAIATGQVGTSAGTTASATASATVAGTPDNAESYTFLRTNGDGSPVTWNACAPIHVVINPAGAPDGGVQDMLDALTKLSEATGLTFTYDGLVDNALHKNWGQGAEAGFSGWAPVLVGWTTPASGLLEDVTGGRTTTVRANTGGDATYVSAMVAINATLDANRTPGFGAASSRGSLYMHELAHVVGLGHTDDHGQLMHPNGAFGDHYAAGDAAGLTVLGSQGCISTPAASW